MALEESTILIVEDEPAIAELLAFTVRSDEWDAHVANSVADAEVFLQRRTPQLVLLDWNLPDQSGLRLLSRLRSDRAKPRLPVIMITAKGMEEDKVAALDTGADDYLTKPFSPLELRARIKALLRGRNPERVHTTTEAGQVVLDASNYSVMLGGRKIEIGNAEFKLLKFLMEHPERVFSRDQLLDQVWGSRTAIEERTVDVHVLRLRRALKDAETMVKTVRGVGYMLSNR